MPLVDAAFAVGKETAKLVVQNWLKVRKDKSRRESQLIDLIATGVADSVKRRKLSRQFEEIADQITIRLEPFYSIEFANLPENERLAALEAVTDTLAEADLCDATLFSSDMEPTKLAYSVRKKVPDGATRVYLTDSAKILYERVLDDVCVAIVRIVQQLPEFESRALTELLGRVALAIEKIEGILTDLPRVAPHISTLRGELEESSKTDRSSHVEREAEFKYKYFEHVSVSMDRLEVFGVDTRKYRPKPLVTASYVTLTATVDYSAEPRRSYKLGDAYDLENSIGGVDDEERLTAELAFSDSRRTLVRGDAGSGKTTLLQWIAINAARGSFSKLLAKWNNIVPLFVKLRSYADRPFPTGNELLRDAAPSLMDSAPPDWVAKSMSEGQVVLLIDGIDELPHGKRMEARRWLADLLQGYEKIEAVVTSRPGAVDASWLNELGFDGIRLEPMAGHDIRVFCRRWHLAMEDAARRGATTLPCAVEELAEYESVLLRDLDSRRHTRALATNPLLCAMLCALNLDRRKNLPPDRMKLYDAAIELLVERRDIERDIPTAVGHLQLGIKTKISILQHLAWHFTSAERSELDYDHVVEHTRLVLERIPNVDANARQVVDFLLERSGIIRQPVIGRVDFVHRTFQEYLAAKEVADAHLVDQVITNSHRDQWHGTIVMAAGHCAYPLQLRLLGGILERASAEAENRRRLALLAAACLETASSVPPEVSEAIYKYLAPLFPPQGITEARALAIGGKWALDRLPKSLEDVSEVVGRACVEAAAFIDEEGSLQLLKAYAQDPRIRIQRNLTSVWRYFDAERYATEVLADAPLERGLAHIEDPNVLPHIHHLRNLKTVSLMLHATGPVRNLDFLMYVADLYSLSVRTIDPIDLSPLERYPNLRQVTILGDEIAEQSSSVFQYLPSLIGLSLPGVFAGKEMERIANLPRLRNLTLFSGQSMQDYMKLFHLANLHRLVLNNCARLVSMRGAESMRSLRSLRLVGPNLRGGLSALEGVLDRLEILSIEDCRTVKSLEPLRDAPLRELRLVDCDAGDLQYLSGALMLQKLSLVGVRMSNLQSVAGLPELRLLDVRGSTAEVDLRPFSGRKKTLDVTVSPSQHVIAPEAGNVKISTHRSV